MAVFLEQDLSSAFDVISHVENVVGSAFADFLQSGNGGNFFLASGGGGHDVIYATGQFYDGIRGDDGNDILFGWNGSPDDFWLQYDRGMDIVRRFSNADTDHVLVRRSEFNLATPGEQLLLASELETRAQGGATSPGTRFIHETDTGILWADKDGSGPTAAVPIANFEAGVTLAGYIFVI